MYLSIQELLIETSFNSTEGLSMKAKMLIFTGFLAILFSQADFAQCSSCYKSYSESSCSRCNSSFYSCESTTGCTCSDPTCYRKNSCLDRRTCCEAFGNVGHY